MGRTPAGAAGVSGPSLAFPPAASIRAAPSGASPVVKTPVVKTPVVKTPVVKRRDSVVPRRPLGSPRWMVLNWCLIPPLRPCRWRQSVREGIR